MCIYSKSNWGQHKDPRCINAKLPWQHGLHSVLSWTSPRRQWATEDTEPILLESVFSICRWGGGCSCFSQKLLKRRSPQNFYKIISSLQKQNQEPIPSQSWQGSALSTWLCNQEMTRVDLDQGWTRMLSFIVRRDKFCSRIFRELSIHTQHNLVSVPSHMAFPHLDLPHLLNYFSQK